MESVDVVAPGEARVEQYKVVPNVHRGDLWDGTRLKLLCPNGHVVVDAPNTNATGKRIADGDFSHEWCGACSWTGQTMTPAARTLESP